jgi:hypothetical protein
MLELTGAYRSKQHRQRQAAPKSSRPIGGPPEHLAPDEVGVWHEMTASLPAGVLTSDDQMCMEVVARLTAWQRRGGLLRAPYLAVLLRGLRELGVGPGNNRCDS